jgi:AraC-like DNA-binding protein
VLERADVEIPGEQYIALWVAAGQVNPNVGLELGSLSEADDFGAFGHALHCAPDMKSVLKTLHKFVIVFAQESKIDYCLDANSVRLEYQIIAPTILHRRQDSEFTIAAILKQMSLISGRSIQPTRVDFEHAKPADIAPHKQLFKCPIYFQQPTNRIHFPLDVLQLPVSNSNERLYQALEPYLEREREARLIADELLPQITHMVAARLGSGVPTLGEVCDQLNVSRRTLQRRLKELGIDFSELVEYVRRELAISYMKSTSYSISEISLLVGYSESASFTRAFRRWTGQSPQQYRTTASASQY